MFLKKHWTLSNSKQILAVFTIWRVALFLVLLFAINFIPLAGKNFFGGGLGNYTANPYLFAWANFDGEHYLSIAQFGYKDLEQAFFPIYPAIIHLLSFPWQHSFTSVTLIGLLISNISFFLALYFLFKLLRFDYSVRISYLVLLIILAFPTAFYFASVYNEALFFLLAILTFYFARKKRWFWVGIFGMVAAATRVFGIILFLALLIEAWQGRVKIGSYFWILLIPLGLIAYMIYQWVSVADPLAFYHLQTIVGPQHESGIILLPQIYFRYTKILLTSELSNPIYPIIVLEFAVGLSFFILPIIGFLKKVRLSYLAFALIGFLLPSVQGSFSSAPRYVLILFPSFLVLGIIVDSLPKLFKIGYFIMSGILLIFFSMLFFRGYWVA